MRIRLPWLRIFVGCCVAATTVVSVARGSVFQIEQDHPVFQLLVTSPPERFRVAAELILDPASVPTEEIRDLTSRKPMKYLFRASKTATAALDFVLMKRDGGTVTGADAATASTAPNVLVMSVAGLRADFVGAYGQPLPTTPRIDRLAAEGARFDTAWSTSAWSVPGNASLLTSQYPSRHGIESTNLSRETRLPREVVTLAELLKTAGYDTAAVVADRALRPLRGFADGFDVYVESARDAVRVAATTRLWLEWHRFHVARGLEPQSFFLFLQFRDLDDPAPALPAYRELFRADSGDGRPEAHLKYAAKVRAVDDQVGLVLDALAAQGLADRTLVLLTASHGRELGERGSTGAATSLHVEQLRVPLIARLPGAIAAGQAVAGPASILDVLPAVASWTGNEPKSSEGMDSSAIVLAPGETRDAVVAPRTLFAELGPAERPWDEPFHARAAWSGDWKLMVRREEGGENRRQLFATADDPGERTNRSDDAAHGAVMAELESALRAHMAAAPTRTAQPTPATPAPTHPHAH